MVPRTHYIHSRNGRIDAGTDNGPADLDAIFSSLRGSGQKRLIVHFHGGLVSKASGLEIAERLMPVYSPGGYPLFFIWESGAWETVRNNLADITKEPIFREVLRKLLEYTLNHVGMSNGTRSIAGSQIDPRYVKKQLNTWFQNPAGEPVPFSGEIPATDTITTRAAEEAVNENDIQIDIAYDTDLLNALQGVAELPAEVRTGIVPVAPIPTRANSATLNEIAPYPASATRGLISLLNVARLLARILKRVLGRLAASRGHGFYTTVVEEVLREMYGDVIGQSIFWNQMKKDTTDAFGGDPNLHVGTAFLERLKNELANGLNLEKIFLVGHSTGGIYISNLLAAVDAMQFAPSLQFDIVLLAPANTHRLFHETVSKHGARIRFLRMFGMQDDIERDDGLLGDDWRRALYPSSLLYFVSGLLEPEPDTPLLGMQRFLNLDAVFKAPEYADVAANRAWFQQYSEGIIWSKTSSSAQAGWRSEARKHGDFDNDRETLCSLTQIVRL